MKFSFSPLLFLAFTIFLFCPLINACADDEQNVQTQLKNKTRDSRLEGTWHENVKLDEEELHYVHHFNNATGQYSYYEQTHPQQVTQKYYYTEGQKIIFIRPGQGLKIGRSELEDRYWFSPQLDTLYIGEITHPQRLFRK